MVKRLKKLLIKNLINDIRTKAGPMLIGRVMDKFQVGLMGKVTKEDPAAPEHFKDEFVSMLNESFESSLVVTPEGIHFSLGDTAKLGYDGVINSPLQTMVFIMEGILGEYAFISPAIYGSVKGGRNVKFGRWSGGFLITKAAFFEEGWSKRVSWEKAKWGFSNTGPINVFEIDQTFVSEIVDSSIKRTIEEFSASLRAEHGKK
jgi:hypothetical protein